MSVAEAQPFPEVPFDSSKFRYRGDGSVPDKSQYDSRGERGVYLADKHLVNAVNTAIIVGQPLLVVGESGTGKTMLAWSIASELGLLPVLEFHTRSDHHARDVLFVIDNLRRFYHAQIKDKRADDLTEYIRYAALGEAIRSGGKRVVLIDEIDKATRDFPNDLLDEIDQMQFEVPDTGEKFKSAEKPIVVITSNSERQLPDPFLRRCVFHQIAFPKPEDLVRILGQRLEPGVDSALIDAAVAQFGRLRAEALKLQKKPSTGELIVWLRMLVHAGVDPAKLAAAPLAGLPFKGALIKNDNDLGRVQRATS
ncbi:MAG TPA: MoxR family ATPase [Thermoanaerobaculia bacterium]|nr:MoxR family ATPase [Thermoanaerobaculia bacterium]